MGRITERKTDIKCPTCGRNYKYITSYRVLPESKWAKMFLKDYDIFLEKVVCDCGTFIFYNNVIPNWQFYQSLGREIESIMLDFKDAYVEVFGDLRREVKDIWNTFWK